MSHTVKILDKQPATHNVWQLRLEKPEGYSFTPGQATEVAIDKEGWRDQKRPFSFTCLPEDEHLEFTIKAYRDHDGVTKQMDDLKPGDALIIDDPWGTIEYKGPGYFLAGGAGLTPFMSIFRHMHRKGCIADCCLLYSNRTVEDIIYRDELEATLGVNLFFTITRQETVSFHDGHLNESFLKEKVIHPEKYFYVCGPKDFVEEMQKLVEKVGGKAESVVLEQ